MVVAVAGARGVPQRAALVGAVRAQARAAVGQAGAARTRRRMGGTHKCVSIHIGVLPARRHICRFISLPLILVLATQMYITVVGFIGYNE